MADRQDDLKDRTEATPSRAVDDGIQAGEVVNVSGHKQELDRIFSPLSIISLAIASGNTWLVLAGSIVGDTECDRRQQPLKSR